MCCFRFKLWWMTQRMGTCGKEVPLETQFMLVESKEEGGSGEDAATVYTVFLPLLEGQFRAALQGNEQNQVEICLESGMFTKPRFFYKIVPLPTMVDTRWTAAVSLGVEAPHRPETAAAGGVAA